MHTLELRRSINGTLMTLVKITSSRGEVTYKPPSAKTQQHPTFCLSGKSNGFKAGIGMIRITISVIIFKDAFEYQSGLYARQWPGTVGSQKRATGTQFKNALKMAQVPYTVIITPMMQQTMRIFLVGKTWKYWMMTEALAVTMAAL